MHEQGRLMTKDQISKRCLTEQPAMHSSQQRRVVSLSQQITHHSAHHSTQPLTAATHNWLAQQPRTAAQPGPAQPGPAA